MFFSLLDRSGATRAGYCNPEAVEGGSRSAKSRSLELHEPGGYSRAGAVIMESRIQGYSFRLAAFDLEFPLHLTHFRST